MQNSLTLPCRRRLQIMSIPIQQVFLRMMPILKQIQTKLPIQGSAIATLRMKLNKKRILIAMQIQAILGMKLMEKKKILK